MGEEKIDQIYVIIQYTSSSQNSGQFFSSHNLFKYHKINDKDKRTLDEHKSQQNHAYLITTKIAENVLYSEI